MRRAYHADNVWTPKDTIKVYALHIEFAATRGATRPRKKRVDLDRSNNELVAFRFTQSIQRDRRETELNSDYTREANLFSCRDDATRSPLFRNLLQAYLKFYRDHGRLTDPAGQPTARHIQ